MGKIMARIVWCLLAMSIAVWAGEMYVLRPHQSGGPKVYQITREKAAAQPKWSMGQPLPLPLEKLAQIALEKTVNPNSPDAKFWKVECVQLWRMDDHTRALSPHFQATADKPEALQDRWFCEFQLSCYKDYTGGWWKNTRYVIVLLDGTYVPTSDKEATRP